MKYMFSASRALQILVVLLVVSACEGQALGQCSMCRDSTAGTSPQVRAGLRRAIPVLAVPAFLICCGVLLLALRRDGHE